MNPSPAVFQYCNPLTDPPPGSAATVEDHEDGITVTVPPSGTHPAVLIAGIVALLFISLLLFLPFTPFAMVIGLRIWARARQATIISIRSGRVSVIVPAFPRPRKRIESRAQVEAFEAFVHLLPIRVGARGYMVMWTKSGDFFRFILLHQRLYSEVTWLAKLLNDALEADAQRLEEDKIEGSSQ